MAAVQLREYQVEVRESRLRFLVAGCSAIPHPPSPIPRPPVGILSKVIFFPVTGPIAGIKWSLGQVQKVVEEELTDDEPVKRDLMELQMQLELGDIDDAEYVRREAELMTRLRDVRAWRAIPARGERARRAARFASAHNAGRR